MGDIAEAIQLSLAPVFLLVAIAGFLNVITNRLGRVVDRARDMESQVKADTDAQERASHQTELRSLDRRITFNHWSINFFSIAALTTTVLVAAIFLTGLNGAEASALIAGLFGLAMGGILIGICFFLAEIYSATLTVRVQSELLQDMHEDTDPA